MGLCVSHLPSWCIIYIFARSYLICEDLFNSFTDKGTGPLSPSRTQRHKVEPIIRNLQNVHIPTSTLPPRPNLRTTSTGRRGRRDLSLSHNEKATDDDGNDALQDWNERASSLFEWVGMINIGAQRYVPCSVVLDVMIT